MGSSRIRIGISACLLGERVRYDGGHKRDNFLTDILGPHVEWVPVCPEVEVGMGTPREPVRLVRSGDSRQVRMITVHTGIDYTDRMDSWARRRLEQLAKENLSGYVLKSNSPSCGLENVKVYSKESLDRAGRGLFASALAERFPSLPVEEEGRLNDPGVRENFIERIFAYGRLTSLFARRWSVPDLERFHTAHKLALAARSPVAYQELGRIIALEKRMPKRVLRDRYLHLFMKALALPSTRRSQTRVLLQIRGELKRVLDDGSKRELDGVIDQFRRGLVPLIVPITIIRHHVRVQRVEYLAGQTWLEPDPRELMLRNHV